MMTVPGWLSEDAPSERVSTGSTNDVGLSRTLLGPRLPLRPVPTRPPDAGASVIPATVHPFTADELEAAWTNWSTYSPVLADVMLVLARTGLRWSEARALTVADADAETLGVEKSTGPDGRTRPLPARRVRGVPVATRIRPIIERLVAGRDGTELLLTTSLGEPLRRTSVLNRLDWPHTAHGRRLHDLRHTAAHLWLAEGADPAAVRAWLG